MEGECLNDYTLCEGIHKEVENPEGQKLTRTKHMKHRDMIAVNNMIATAQT